MSNIIHEIYVEIMRSNTTEDCFAALENGARQLGFDFFAFGICLPFPLTAPEFRIISNYPLSWLRTYQGSGYIRTDPTVRHGLKSFHPVLWSDAVNTEDAEFWEDARGHGLAHGWAQSTRGVDGTRGMLTLARSGEVIDATEAAEKLPMLIMMSVAAHDGVTKLISRRTTQPAVSTGKLEGAHQPLQNACSAEVHKQLDHAKVLTTLNPVEIPRLTHREIEVLRWTAEGKISVDIASILGITERTVNFHINNCMKRLGATSRTSVAVQAALWGLL